MTTEIKKYDFKEGLPIEFEIMNISNLFHFDKEALTSPHRTGFYHILWFQTGNPVHHVDFNPLQMEPNSLLFLNKDVVQFFDGETKHDGKAILFTDDFFCRTADDVKYLRSNPLFNYLLTAPSILLENSSPLFSVLFELMEKESKAASDQYQADMLKNYLHNFLLLAERESRKQNDTLVKKSAAFDSLLLFLDLLEQQFKENKSVSNYAAQMNITEKKLNQATAKVLGKTPKHIVDERVLLEAKRLLAHTAYSIKEIGFSIGFDEPTNFIKYFRKHNQLTPLEFREQILHGAKVSSKG